jgi:hypothetical protein
MVSRKRWLSAQTYERSFWANAADQIAAGGANLDWYSWKAQQMEKHLAPFLTDQFKRDAKVLEIGCGPIGIVSYLGWGDRLHERAADETA